MSLLIFINQLIVSSKIFLMPLMNVKGFMIDVPLVQCVKNNSCSIN